MNYCEDSENQVPNQIHGLVFVVEKSENNKIIINCPVSKNMSRKKKTEKEKERKSSSTAKFKTVISGKARKIVLSNTRDGIIFNV